MKVGLPAVLLVLGLASCGQDPGGAAIEQPDPLHEHDIRLPPDVPPPPRRVDEAPGRSFEPVTAPPPFSEGIFPCSRCHAGGPPDVDSAPALPHDRHLDMGIECVDCHEDAEGHFPLVPDSDLCFGCHEQPEDDTEGFTAYFAALPKEGEQWVLPRRWDLADVAANHAGHAEAGVECQSCHGELQAGRFARPRAVPLMDTCVSCHEERGVPVSCETCHEEHLQPQHANIVLRHAEDQRTCFGCHDPDDRDTLRLANGTRIAFDQSYRLCGQCHGTKYRDWKEGLHGKRTGMWDGDVKYLLCVHCHQNPHQPAFPPMEPLPPPVRPEDIR
jgi:hypothetical protein